MSRRNSRNHPVFVAERIKVRYPEIYNTMTPHVNGIIGNLDRRRRLSSADLNRLSDRVVRNSNMDSDPPYGVGRRAIRDIAGILLLAALLG